MIEKLSPLTKLRAGIADGQISLLDIARESAQHANTNASGNTYIHFDSIALAHDAESMNQKYAGQMERPSLFGVPISLKDCFDLAGTRTTCGSRFYASRLPAKTDSAIAAQLHNAGALVTGKTHLHPLAYGITGQNAEYGDCLQPRDAALLTGGSSSGAAASVQEGSALAAIGTDTGGSIRVPAALCGLVGFRASHGLASATGYFPQTWTGAAHLAPSFDTIGLLLRDPRDVGLLANALFNIPLGDSGRKPRLGIVTGSFLADCEQDVLSGVSAWKQHLASICVASEIEPTAWDDTLEIFAGIQAHEAAAIHQGHFEEFESTIRDRLRWGDSLTRETLDDLHARLLRFRACVDTLFEGYDLLMLPAAPVSRLYAHADTSDARRVILRYTTPFSLAGLPTISLPGEFLGAPFGTGVQIAAAPGKDSFLLAFARVVGDSIAKQ